MKFVISILLFSPVFLYSQMTDSAQLIPVINGLKIEPDSSYHLSNGEELSISTLRFYISNPQVIASDGTVNYPNKSHHLFDLEQPETAVLEINSENIDRLAFDLGIDSLTNVSGILDGDLDPIKGMYWTWNSGYINFKLEGTMKSSGGEIQKFEYHIGGYFSPFETLQHITITFERNSEPKNIYVHIDELLQSIDVKENNSIMIPGKNAVEIASMLPLIFSTSLEHE